MTSRLFASFLASLALCTSVVGCEQASRSEVSGVQSFCVLPVSGPDGPAFEVTVQVDACLSSSCDKVISSECGATEVDGVMQLEASATIESKGDTCTADCGGVEVTCTVPAEEERVYVFRDDDGDEVEIEASATERACSVEPI